MKVDEPTEHDLTEVSRFTIYLRQVSQATKAGVPFDEARRVLHDEMYGAESKVEQCLSSICTACGTIVEGEHICAIFEGEGEKPS